MSSRYKWCGGCFKIYNKRKRLEREIRNKLLTHKICNSCLIEKTISSFILSQNKCKDCVSINNKKWKKENTEKVRVGNKKWAQENLEKKKTNNKKWARENPEKNRASSKKWRKANPEKAKEHSRRWAQNNPEKKKANGKKWQQENREKINAKQRDRYQNDPVYRNRCIVSVAIYTMIKSQGASKKGESSHNYVPWTLKEYRTHIESLFEPWMNWNNQGIYNPKTHHLPNGRTWQLDHIIPQSDLPFNSLDHPNLTKAWNLSNLRPLDAEQNIIDGATKIRHRNKERK